MSCSHVFYFIISDNNISFQELQPAITVTTFRQMSHCIVVLYFIQGEETDNDPALFDYFFLR